MATSQPKTAVAPKPLMIRGDRLLLFLDVIALLRRPEDNPRGLSRERINAILIERLGWDNLYLATLEYWYMDFPRFWDPAWRSLYDLREVFRANLATLGSTPLVVPPLYDRDTLQRDRETFLRVLAERIDVSDAEIEIARAQSEGPAHECLFSAIASDELTEEDFREVTR